MGKKARRRLVILRRRCLMISTKNMAKVRAILSYLARKETPLRK